MKTLEFLKPVNLNNKIRLGNNFDGGYVVYERCLSDIQVLLTYGVGWDVQFEVDLNDRYGTTVLMFDPTMFGKTMLDFKRLFRLLKSFKFIRAKNYIAYVWELWNLKRSLEKKNVFFKNEGIADVDKEKYATFTNHLNRFDLKGKRLLVKIDIEGDEYLILNGDFMKNLYCVDQLIIEFHSVDRKMGELSAIIRQLNEDFALVHIHGNNHASCFSYNQEEGDTVRHFEIPTVLECTFVRKSSIAEADIVVEDVSYPIASLDFPNNAEKEDILLPFI